MPRCLVRTHAVTQDCEVHLTNCNAAGTEIESYLTQYLLVVLCADMQQEIYMLSERRASSAADNGLSSFVASSSRKILRSIGKSDIANYVGLFGAECKDRLNSQLTDAEVTIYNNAVSRRHEVAHNLGTQITFTEFKEAVRIAEKILGAADDSLNPVPGPGEATNQ